MFEPAQHQTDKVANYKLLLSQLTHLLEGEPNFIANLANASALLSQGLDSINWVGFYLFDAERRQLVLGPFQGLPACVRIPIGKGVCGTALEQNATQLVHDVHSFPGHIACDSRSRSELVVPLRQGATPVGVLDVDSPEPGRFDGIDQEWLERFAVQLMAHHFQD